MKYLVIWTFAEKLKNGLFNITYRNEVFDFAQNIKSYGCCSIRFRNLGSTNITINGQELLFIGESIAYNNLPDCIIINDFKIS